MIVGFRFGFFHVSRMVECNYVILTFLGINRKGRKGSLHEGSIRFFDPQKEGVFMGYLRADFDKFVFLEHLSDRPPT